MHTYYQYVALKGETNTKKHKKHKKTINRNGSVALLIIAGEENGMYKGQHLVPNRKFWLNGGFFFRQMDFFLLHFYKDVVLYARGQVEKRFNGVIFF